MIFFIILFGYLSNSLIVEPSPPPNTKTFKSGFTFQNKHTSKNTNTYKTNVYNTEIIDGEYKVIDDEDKKK